MNNTEIVAEFFKPGEFLCAGKPCLDRMHPVFLQALVQLRRDCNFPFTLNSTWRSLAHNRRVGGEKNSMHLQGRAADISCSDSRQRAILIRTALNMGLTVGVMENAIHVDNREGEPIVFHYYAKYRK